MPHVHTQKITNETKGVTKVTVTIEYPHGMEGAAKVAAKAKEFVRWVDNPDQKELDLATTTQVTISNATLRVDEASQAKGKLYSLGATAKIPYEDQSQLFNLMQTDKKVVIIVREVEDSKKKAKSETTDGKAAAQGTPVN